MLRLCYKGVWIEPDPVWFMKGGRMVWTGRFFLEREEGDGLLKEEYEHPGEFKSEDSATEAAYHYAKELVDQQEATSGAC